jgi:5-methylcytosine-specific restriction enzyme subunit McrC
MAIRLQNVYYLLCYAWDQWESRGFADVNAVSGDRVESLLGQVLRDAVGNLLRRGLDRGYLAAEEEGRRLRGKLLVSPTIQRMLIRQGRVACLVDELSHDVPHNRIIKAAITALVAVPGLDKEIRAGLLDHRRRMYDVSDVDLSAAAFRGVQLHRNVASYAFALNVCQLVARSLIPEPGSGKRRFHPFTANEQEMGRLFEAFVRNFLKREQREFRVSAAKVEWNAISLHESDLSLLPEMRTDVLLASSLTRVAIETKFYASPFQIHYGGKKLISSHLYQLLAYLSHLGRLDGPEVVGVLLYAVSGEDLRLDYRLGGHKVLIRSVDLGRDWLGIRSQILGLARELSNRPDGIASPEQQRIDVGPLAAENAANPPPL